MKISKTFVELTLAEFQKKKVSTDYTDTKYKIGGQGEEFDGTPDIKWQNVVKLNNGSYYAYGQSFNNIYELGQCNYVKQISNPNNVEAETGAIIEYVGKTSEEYRNGGIYESEVSNSQSVTFEVGDGCWYYEVTNNTFIPNSPLGRYYIVGEADIPVNKKPVTMKLNSYDNTYEILVVEKSGEDNYSLINKYTGYQIVAGISPCVIKDHVENGYPEISIADEGIVPAIPICIRSTTGFLFLGYSKQTEPDMIYRNSTYVDGVLLSDITNLKSIACFTIKMCDENGVDLENKYVIISRSGSTWLDENLGGNRGGTIRVCVHSDGHVLYGCDNQLFEKIADFEYTNRNGNVVDRTAYRPDFGTLKYNSLYEDFLEKKTIIYSADGAEVKNVWRWHQRAQ